MANYFARQRFSAKVRPKLKCCLVLHRHLEYIAVNLLPQYFDIDFVWRCVPKSNITGVELPRMNYDYNGMKHRFVYLTCVEMSAVATKVKVHVMSLLLMYYSKCVF